MIWTHQYEGHLEWNQRREGDWSVTLKSRKIIIFDRYLKGKMSRTASLKMLELKTENFLGYYDESKTY